VADNEQDIAKVCLKTKKYIKVKRMREEEEEEEEAEEEEDK